MGIYIVLQVLLVVFLLSLATCAFIFAGDFFYNRKR